MTELELEAEKYARRFEENEQNGYNGESISIEDRIEMEAFIAGVTSNAAKEYWYKQFEKQKLEFAIEQLKKASMLIVSQHERKANLRIIIELEQKLSEL